MSSEPREPEASEHGSVEVAAPDPAVERVVSGRAWEEFCDTLKASGNLVLEMSDEDDVIDRVEGFRHLARLVRGGLESYLEVGDPRFPLVSGLPNQVKIGSDNPDSTYQSANIDGRYDYRLWGTRGTVHYLGFGAYAGNYGGGAARLGHMGSLDGSDLEVADDGTFEVILSQAEHPGNWIPLRPERGTLVIRQFHLDREAEEPARVRIERIGADDRPEPISAATLAHGLAGTNLFVDGVVRRFTGKVDEWRERPNTLELDAGMGTGAWGDPNQLFRHGYWTLEPGQMLVVSFVPPPCFYWNFQLDNRWMESLDYRFHPVTVNAASAAAEADGTVRIVVADNDPGFGNWISTCGHCHGAMGLRWNQAEYDVQPTCEVLPVPG